MVGAAHCGRFREPILSAESRGRNGKAPARCLASEPALLPTPFHSAGLFQIFPLTAHRPAVRCSQ
jgi:hypothetical protein